jgi:hypothetical protein
VSPYDDKLGCRRTLRSCGGDVGVVEVGALVEQRLVSDFRERVGEAVSDAGDGDGWIVSSIREVSALSARPTLGIVLAI